MSVGARIMIVDPVSHEFCHEKEDIVKQTLSKESCWNEEYHGNDKVSVTRSVLEPFTLILTQSSYISEWSNQLRQSCRTNFWGPRDLSYLHHALIHRLVHAWSQYGGVLCLPYSW